jgi:hypothetical protein
LLVELKKMRRWPNAYAVSQIKQQASDGVTRMIRSDEALARGDVLQPDVSAWRNRRLAALQKCRDIAALGQSAGAGV